MKFDSQIESSSANTAQEKQGLEFVIQSVSKELEATEKKIKEFEASQSNLEQHLFDKNIQLKDSELKLQEMENNNSEALREFESQISGERAKHDCSADELRQLLESESKSKIESARAQST